MSYDIVIKRLARRIAACPARGGMVDSAPYEAPRSLPPPTPGTSVSPSETRSSFAFPFAI